MDRRGFLGLLGATVAGLALQEAIPFNRVWSFPAKIVIPQSTSIRFIRAWSMQESMMLNRIDMAYGFGNLEIPDAFERAVRFDLKSSELLEDSPIVSLIPPEAMHLLKDGLKGVSLDRRLIRSVQWADPPPPLTD